MALPCGTNNKDTVDSQASWWSSLGRGAGFLTVAAPAVLVVVAVVLLPPYARLARAKYDLGCARADFIDAEKQIAANKRLITALPVDEVLTKRLAQNQLPCRPANEIVVAGPGVGAGTDVDVTKPPDLVRPPRSRRPSPPPAWMATFSAKLSKPPTRRGLLLLALGAIITAVYLFAPQRKQRTAGNRQ